MEKSYNINKVLIPIIGFVSAAIMTTSLSTYVLFIHYFSIKVNTSIPILILWGNVIYFAGMPLGKIVGRFLRFYKNLPYALASMAVLISLTIALMPFASSFIELMAFRFLQGMVTIYMEIFSNVYSFLYDDFSVRNLASSVSISGIPGGVAIGTSAYVLANENPITVFIALSLVSLIFSLLYSFLLKNAKIVLNKLKYDEPRTTYRMGITWLMGFYWALIAGFNLILSIVLPSYISMYSPPDVPLAMQIFGYTGALFTVISGIIGYFIKSIKKMIIIISASFVLSFIGFLLLWYLEPTGINLAIIITLVMMEGLVVPFIYSIPRYVYPEKLVAKGTWEFALIGSSFHVWSALLVLGIGLYFDFRLVMLILVFPPLYGIIFTLMLPKLFYTNNIK